MGEVFPVKYKITYSWESTYDWNSLPNSHIIWGNTCNAPLKITELCIWHQVAQSIHICISQGFIVGSCTKWCLLLFIPLSLVTCWALWNRVIAPYLLLLPWRRKCRLLSYTFFLFLLLPCWSGSFCISLVIAYKHTQARWLKPSICVKIYVRNREVKGSKYRC